VIVELQKLTEDDLCRILSEPKNSILEEYIELLESEGVRTLPVLSIHPHEIRTPPLKVFRWLMPQCLGMDRGFFFSSVDFRLLYSFSSRESPQVKLTITEEAKRAIARKAELSGTGARSLRGIVESFMMGPMYEVPGSDIVEVIIHEQVLTEGALPEYRHKAVETPTAAVAGQ
jgi:ATP-dependent protease Clp ATPase subunit